jgi:hypothetical protein
VTADAFDLGQTLRDLSTRYAAGVDRRNRDYFLGAFHPDATMLVDRPGSDQPHPLHGHQEIGRVVEWIAAYPKTFHLLGQSQYDVSESAAVGEVYCQANHYASTDQGDVNRVMHIRYQDEYRPGADGTWRIGLRQVVVDWTETRPIDLPVDRPGSNR